MNGKWKCCLQQTTKLQLLTGWLPTASHVATYSRSSQFSATHAWPIDILVGDTHSHHNCLLLTTSFWSLVRSGVLPCAAQVQSPSPQHKWDNSCLDERLSWIQGTLSTEIWRVLAEEDWPKRASPCRLRHSVDDEANHVPVVTLLQSSFITGSIARSANLPVFNLLRGRFWGFSHRRGNTLHRWRWNLACQISPPPVQR